MAGEGRSFAALIEQIRQGSEVAATELIERFGPHIVRVVRRRLSRRLRSQFDSVDFVQAVWASVFAQREALSRFSGPDALVAFLITVARNKVIDEARRRLIYENRNINRELPQHWCSDISPLDEIAGPEPRPSQIAMAKELLEENRFASDRDKLQQQILRLRTAGVSQDEIAAKLAVHPKTVQRFLNAFAEQFPWVRQA